MVGYKKNNTEFETVVENNYCTHNPLKGVGVVIWYLSIPPHNNSRAVVKNLRILVYRSSLRLTIPYLKLNIVTSHHQVVSIF